MFNRLRDYALLVKDQVEWRSRLRRALPPAASASGPTVMLCDLLTSVSTLKTGAMFAAALTAQGYRPLVLMQHPWRLAKMIFAPLAESKFVYLNDYSTPELRRHAAAEAEALLAADPDFRALADIEIDGFRIGRNVLSIVTRSFRVGRLDPGNASHRALVAEKLAESLATKAASQRMLAEHRPNHVLFCERGYTPAGEMFDACLLAGIDCVQWQGAPQADHMLFKRYSMANRKQHPLALSDDSWRAVSTMDWPEARNREVMDKLSGNYRSGAWFNRQQLQNGKTIKDAEAVQRQLGLDPAKKTAVIFCHIVYDATFFYGDSLFPDYECWLVEAVRCAIANPNLNWVIKVHPVNVWRSKMDGAPMEQLEVMALRREFGELPDHVRIMPADTDINTFSLFSAIDYGLTVRGTIGMELPCFGIPTVTAGTGRYSGRGITLDPGTPEEFRQLLARLHEVEPLDARTIEMARRYAYGTFFLRPFPITSFETDYNTGSSAKALALNVKVLADRPLDRCDDMVRIAAWIAAGREDDLMQIPAALSS